MLNNRSTMPKFYTIVCHSILLTCLCISEKWIYVRQVAFNYNAKSIGMESSKSVLACQGDRLALTCNGTARSQQWNVFHGNETAHNHVVAILSPNTVHPQEITVNQVLFHFSITSTSPLMSTVTIDNVTSNANGVRLVCTHSAGMSTSRTINVVASNAIVSIPSIMVKESYGANNITVILEWEKQELISYNIAISPDAVVQESNENSRLRAQLAVAYNIIYHVKFVATLCDVNTTKVFAILYTTCDHLLELSANIVISGYTIPALVGSNITLSCLIEDVPTAPNASITITCMDNGQWAPDPRQLIDDCSGETAANTHTMTEKYSSTTPFNNSVIFSGTTFSHGVTIGITVTASVMIIAIIAIIIGYPCGYFCMKRKHSVKTLTNIRTSEQLSTFSPGVLKDNDPQGLEMVENVAYVSLGPANIISKHT